MNLYSPTLNRSSFFKDTSSSGIDNSSEVGKTDYADERTELANEANGIQQSKNEEKATKEFHFPDKIENPDFKQECRSSSIPDTVGKPIQGKRAKSGFSSLLGQFTKKQKTSVMEDTLSDWNKYKDNEGINEQLKTYNRGREG